MNKKLFLTLLSILIIVFLLFCIPVSAYVDENTLSSDTYNYSSRLFDDSFVHSINIRINGTDFEQLIKNAEKEIYFPCDIVIDDELFEDVGIRIKGNSSLSLVETLDSNRYSFKIKFDYFKKNYSYYGLNELVLNNLISDSTYIKDYIVYDMMRFNGVVTPLNAYMDISFNDEPWGLYLGVEAPEKSFLIRNYGINHGNLYKPEIVVGDSNNIENSNGTNLVFVNNNLKNYSGIFNNVETLISISDKNKLINKIYELNYSANVENILDVDSIIRYWVVHNFSCNYDSYIGPIAHNYYLYEKNGILTMLPWDYNLAFGSFAVGPKWFGNAEVDLNTLIVNMPIDNPLNSCNENNRPLWGRIIQNEEYKKLYHEYFDIFIDSYFNSGYFVNKVDSLYNMLLFYVQKDVTAFYTIDEFTKGIKELKEICILRAISIENQLNGNISSSEFDKNNYVDASYLNRKEILSNELFKNDKEISLFID